MATLPSLQSLIETDLQAICDDLQEEFRAMSGKGLLITGGAGFLGYYLIQSVLYWNRQHPTHAPIKVTVFDNYVRGVPPWLDALGKEPNLSLRKVDMIDPLPVDMGDQEYIVHAAGIASPQYYRAHPLKTIDANINGLRNLLEYAKKRIDNGKPFGGLIFYSSSEIYGDPSKDMIPTPEDYRGFVSCTGPRAAYDESKRFGETLTVVYAKYHGVPSKVVRPFNNYGPGLKITDGRVLPDFARNVMNGEDIVMFSDGSPTRTFCYATDAITGYYKVLVKGQPGESYNVGIEKPEISMLDLANRVVALSKDLFGYQGKVVRKVNTESDYLVDNPNRRCPIIAKARSHVGFDPKVMIDEGLKRSLIWYHYNRQAPEA